MKTINLRTCQSLYIMGLVLLFSCRQADPVTGFDSKSWLSDPEGCKGIRAQVWQQFEPQKNNLLGYDEKYLPKLLGPAAARNLFEKGQKIYSYTISGSERCPQKTNKLTLQLRLNATGKVSEVQTVKE